MLFKELKFPKINLFPDAIFTFPVVNVKLPFILTPSAFQITFGDAEEEFVTSN